jgi:hypothetical protein
MAMCIGCGETLQRFIQMMGTGLMGTLPGISPYVALTLQGWSLASTANFLYEGVKGERLTDPQLAMTGDPTTAKVSKTVWGALGLIAGVIGVCYSLHQMDVIQLGRYAAAMGKVSISLWLVSDATMLLACARSLYCVWNRTPAVQDQPEWPGRIRFISATIVAHLLNICAALIFFKKPLSHAPLVLAIISVAIQGGYSFYFGIRQWLVPPLPPSRDRSPAGSLQAPAAQIV